MKKSILLALSLFFMSCQARQSDGIPKVSSSMREAAMLKMPIPEQGAPASPDNPEPDQAIQPAAATNRKIIRNAQLRFLVSDFATAGKAIEQAVKQVGGQITNSNEVKSDNNIQNDLTIRVPAARLDAFLNEALKESIFTDTKTITAEDVTRRYVDVEARIKSKKTVEATYLNLLKQAKNVEDVLKIEEQLGKIREEREVQEAELRQLKDEVALSTVNLSYYQQTEAAQRPREPFYIQIGHNLADGFRLIGETLLGAFYLLPIGLVMTGFIWLIVRWRKNRRKLAK